MKAYSDLPEKKGRERQIERKKSLWGLADASKSNFPLKAIPSSSASPDLPITVVPLCYRYLRIG